VEPLEGIGAQVGQHELDVVVLGHHPQAFVLQQQVDVGKSLHALAQHVIDRRLVEELLRRMPGAARGDRGLHKRHTVGVHPGHRPVRQHVLLEPVGQADRLPHPHHLFVSGDRPRPALHVRITLDDNHFQAHLAQQVRGGGAGGAVPDHRYVISRGLGHFCLSSARACSVVITTVM
jgi:hypothetical protein